MVSSAPRLVPSTKNCTPVTPSLSEALAVRFTVPDTVASAAGPVRLTMGAVESPRGGRGPIVGSAVPPPSPAQRSSSTSWWRRSSARRPTSAPRRWCPRFWLVSMGSSAPLRACTLTACPDWRGRVPQAANANPIGESSGAVGLSVPHGSRPASANPANTTLLTAGPGGVGSSGAAEITPVAPTAAGDTGEMKVANAGTGRWRGRPIHHRGNHRAGPRSRRAAATALGPRWR